MTALQTFDYSPLTGPVDPAAVAALRRESKASKVQPAAIDDFFLLWVFVIGFLVAAGMVAIVDLGSAAIALWARIGVTAIMGSVAVVQLIGIPYAIYRLVVRWTQFFRAKQFAAANRMTYAVTESKPTWDSMLFNAKVFTSKASNVFTATSEPVFEAGNYHYEIWVDKKLVGTDWGYVVVDLRRPVSRLVLRSTSRRSSRRWGDGAYLRNPVLSLGAAADRRYRLYCPDGSEEEAQRLFTPELIAALNRLGRSVDVEISDNFMFVYSARRFPFPRPRSVTAVFSVIAMVTSVSAVP